jgi:hypothetical protein
VCSPHVQIASYTQEHPSSNEVIVRCQTSGAISAEQGVVEALHIAKQKLNLVQVCSSAAAAAAAALLPPLAPHAHLPLCECMVFDELERLT